MRKHRKWRDILIEQLAADPTAAIGFLQAVMEDYQVFRNSAAVVSAVQAVIESQGGIAEVAKRTGMDSQTLTEVLSSEDAPRIDTLTTILTALGCRLSIDPLKAEDCGVEHSGVDTSVAPIEGTKPEMALATDNK
ncbi:MAG: helix-turn-helix domain-containing protein [Candidatus Poribacteria bacterium]|nr:helix-turn-helix domain-containing protein [Candidatus Poribacteria bacterium]